MPDLNDLHREHGPEAVRAAFDGAAPYKPEHPPPLIQSSAQFVASFTPPDYLIDGVLQRGFMYSFTGRTGSGKTAIALLIAASVALGRAIGPYAVERGRVLYLAGENDIDVRMRWIGLAEHLGFDSTRIDVHFTTGTFKISGLMETVRKEVNALGGVTLVVVDTSAVFFEGKDINDNTQQIEHLKRLRALTELPGSPCVLVLCHPVKNASDDQLIPYGGGAQINEVDGNLTCRKQDTTSEVHWLGKFRGPDFAPVSFQLLPIASPDLVDSKGRNIPTVVARHLSEADKQDLDLAARTRQDALLAAIAEQPGASLNDLARSLGWFRPNGEPYKMLVTRTLDPLKAAKLVQVDRNGPTLTDKGEKALKSACYGRSAVSPSVGTA